VTRARPAGQPQGRHVACTGPRPAPGRPADCRCDPSGYGV